MSSIIQPTANANTPAIGTATGDLIAENPNRNGWSIQNLDSGVSSVLFVRMGTGASATLFHFALKGGTADDDGTAGSTNQTAGIVYTGIISVWSDGASPRYTYLEM